MPGDPEAEPVAEVIADSIHCVERFGRLTTMRLRIPKVVLAQFNKHTTLASNASSSRAIPTKRMIHAVLMSPYIPPEIGKNRGGMSAGEELSPNRARVVRGLWVGFSYVACAVAWLLARLGTHKQVVNRTLDPWSYAMVIATGNDRAWRHFFALRAHPDADPALRVVAEAAQVVYAQSHPVRLATGEWHLPYVNLRDYSGAGWLLKAIKQSVARCARVSYSTFDSPQRQSNQAEDDALYRKLIGSEPMHATPTEHQACAVLSSDQGGRLGPGWMQHRKTLNGEFTA
jgi:thymidylate synthase ThyX